MITDEIMLGFVVGFIAGALFWEFYIRLPGRRHSRDRDE